MTTPFDLPFGERVILCEEDLLALFEKSDQYCLTIEDFYRAAARWTTTEGDQTEDGYVTEPGSDFDLLLAEIRYRFGDVPPGGDPR